MKKKTKSKLRNDIALSFLLAILICMAGAALNSVLFYNSFYRTLSKLNEEPIATISFKYRTAQRKFLERVIWDRLRQESPLYNGDTIHTSELAEATVTFNDGNKLVLQENSMIQIFDEKESEGRGFNASVVRGAAFIDSVEAENGFELTSNGVKIDIEAGSSVFAGDKVQVVNGSANITSKDGGQSVISQGEALSVQDGEILAPTFTVTYPSPNEKIIFHRGTSSKVLFNWNSVNYSSNEQFRFELALDKGFRNRFASRTVNLTEKMELELKQGVYYWRFVNPKNSSSVEAEGKIQMISSPAPVLISPENDFAYSYRKRFPAVRLIWSESPQASSYRVVIADNPELKNPVIEQKCTTTSAVYANLSEGRYWWQVTPFYTINHAGYRAPSKTGEFRILRQGELVSPEMFLPAENATVDRERSARPISFSWHADPEASRYKITISENENLLEPVLSREVSANTFSLKGYSELENKKYYWTVQTIDSEDNISEITGKKVFYALEGKIDQRTVEPADGYRVAWTLMQDMVFTWKRNLPESYNSILEIAKDSDFEKLVYTSDGNGFSLKGILLPIGTYWWRLNSKSEEIDQIFYTAPKSFEVLDLLDASVLQNPVPGGRAVARETKPFEFRWKEVDGADFYKVSIINRKDELVYEDNVTEPLVNVDMYNGAGFVDKDFYKIEVQARANAVPGIVSRRSGRIAEARFQLFKLRPVEVTLPQKNAVLDGLNAFLNGVDINWYSVDKVSDAQVVITRTDGKEREVVIKIPTDEEMKKGYKIAPKSLNADPERGFEAGTYEVVVHAHTAEDYIDISNTDESKRGRFTLSAYKKLSSAKKLTPSPANMDGEYLKNNPPVLNLSWTPVPDASTYIVRIRGKGRANKNVNIKKEIKESSITLNLMEDEYRVISEKNGKYSWSVEGRKTVASAKRVKSLAGEISESEFEIDVPTVDPKKIKSSKNNKKYGRKK